jgi:hypothetical protein
MTPLEAARSFIERFSYAIDGGVVRAHMEITLAKNLENWRQDSYEDVAKLCAEKGASWLQQDELEYREAANELCELIRARKDEIGK